MTKTPHLHELNARFQAHVARVPEVATAVENYYNVLPTPEIHLGDLGVVVGTALLQQSAIFVRSLKTVLRHGELGLGTEVIARALIEVSASMLYICREDQSRRAALFVAHHFASARKKQHAWATNVADRADPKSSSHARKYLERLALNQTMIESELACHVASGGKWPKIEELFINIGWTAVYQKHYRSLSASAHSATEDVVNVVSRLCLTKRVQRKDPVSALLMEDAAAAEAKSLAVYMALMAILLHANALESSEEFLRIPASSTERSEALQTIANEVDLHERDNDDLFNAQPVRSSGSTD